MINTSFRIQTLAKQHSEEYAFFISGPNNWQGVTFKQFELYVRRAAFILSNHGISKGDRIAIIDRNSLIFEIAEKAAWYIGASIIGFDPSTPLKQLTDSKKELNIKLFLQQEVPGHGALKLTLGILESGKEIAGPTINKNEIELEAILALTSGTTAEPRILTYNHAQLSIAIDSINSWLAFPTKRIISWLPLYNMTAKVNNLCALSRGVQCYILEDPKDILPSIRTSNADFLLCVPRLLEKLTEGIELNLAKFPRWLRVLALEVPGFSHIALRLLRYKLFGPHLRRLMVGSAPTSRKAVKMFERMGLVVWDAYGLSECTIPVAMSNAEHCRIGSVGKVVPPNIVKLSSSGEVLLKSPGLFSGYLGTDNSSVFNQDGFYKTGDIAEIDNDGFVFLRGRSKDVIKTSTGIRIHPNEIEKLFAGNPFIQHIFIIGDNRKYLSALVFPNISSIEKTLSCQIDVNKTEDLMKIRELINTEINTINSKLQHNHHIGGFGLIMDRIHDNSKLMTLTLKVKRQALAERYHSEIDSIYDKPS